MIYYLYKLTNLVNGKIYVGCHATKNFDDSYMGSGTRLAYAKRKYGVENFKKEILSVHETPEEMLAEEARIVDQEFVKRKDTYNITCGGGSWYHQNSSSEVQRRKCLKGIEKQRQLRVSDPEWRAKEIASRSASLKKQFKDGTRKQTWPNWSGRTHTPETKKKIGETNSLRQQGEKNSRFGSCWIYSEELHVSKSIQRSFLQEMIAQGWKLGRKMKW